MIAIVDYGAGNLRSIQNMLRLLGVDSNIVDHPKQLGNAQKIILPGVGHFDYGMKQLRVRGFVDALNEKVLDEKKPVLGICLGAQMLTRGSEEGELPGLGWIAADTRRFDSARLDSRLRIPHMGWADTCYRTTSNLFQPADKVPRFYYVHAFHMVCDQEADELCHAVHGYRFVAGVEYANIAGVQFHPEKSHRFGKQLLANFAGVSV